jgi:DNA modification methylase
MMLAKDKVSREGDVWLLGEHRLACGDATKPEAWKRLMAGREAHLIFTDPPYGVSYQGRGGEFEMIRGDDLRRGPQSHSVAAEGSACAK